MQKATIRTVIATATAGLALLAAGPASAEQNQGGSQCEKCSCEIERGDGQTGTVAHGTKMKIFLGRDDQGRAQYQHIQCQNGTWVEVAAFIPRTHLLQVAPVASFTATP